MKRMVLSSYQCGAGMGSVSQIGWEWAHRLSQRTALTLLTHIRNKPAIDAKHAELHPDTQVHYIDTEWLARPLYKLAKWLFPKSEHGVFLIASVDFFLFDWLCLRLLKRLQKQGQHFDMVQIATPVTLAAPSRLHRAGLPVVRGPLNCGLTSPVGFETVLRHEREWVNRLRDWPAALDALWGSSRNTDLFLVATDATMLKLPPKFRHKAIKLVENGVEPTQFPFKEPPAPPSASNPLKVLFVGRLIALKGVDLLMQAVKQANDKGIPVELTVVGDGPEMQSLTTQRDHLNLGSKCRLLGAQPASEVAREMAACHLFSLPSVRESGGAVILEAMATGRPVLSVKYGGPGELVDDAVGKALVLENPAKLQQDLADNLQDCFTHYDIWRQKGITATGRVAELYTWPAKIDHAMTIFDTLGTQGNLHLRHN